MVPWDSVTGPSVTVEYIEMIKISLTINTPDLMIYVRSSLLSDQLSGVGDGLLYLLATNEDVNICGPYLGTRLGCC